MKLFTPKCNINYIKLVMQLIGIRVYMYVWMEMWHRYAINNFKFRSTPFEWFTVASGEMYNVEYPDITKIASNFAEII